MNSQDMVTDFILRRDHFETPFGTFDYQGPAHEACKANDLEPYSNTKHSIEMSKIQDLLKAINAYCGQLAEEYDFSLNFALRPANGLPQSETLIPEKYRWLVAFAVEGGSEGYYVHMGAMLDGGQYQEFGLAKTNTAESAYELTKQTSRFLAAASWN